MTNFEFLLVWLLGMPVYSFLMGFAWPAKLEEWGSRHDNWTQGSVVRIGLGTFAWPLALFACLPFLSYRWGESRRKKVLEGE